MGIPVDGHSEGQGGEGWGGGKNRTRKCVNDITTDLQEKRGNDGRGGQGGRKRGRRRRGEKRDGCVYIQDCID